MNIDTAIRTFADFLNVSYSIALPLLSERSYTSDEDSKSNWIQANWEILVERKVLMLHEYLEVYGSGADYYGGSSRITDINSIPNYAIKVNVKCGIDILNSQEIQNHSYFFEQLVGFKNDFYVDSPPFEFVLVRDENIKKERVFSIKEIKFELTELRNN